MSTDNRPAMQFETGTRSHNYYRNAVEKHWDPHEIDLEADREGAAELPDPAFEGLKRSLALFGAGEESDTPENRAKAHCHYHLTIEGILAQTGRTHARVR